MSEQYGSYYIGDIYDIGHMIWNIIPSQFLESQNCQKPSLYNFTERTPIDPFGAIL